MVSESNHLHSLYASVSSSISRDSTLSSNITSKDPVYADVVVLNSSAADDLHCKVSKGIHLPSSPVDPSAFEWPISPLSPLSSSIFAELSRRLSSIKTSQMSPPSETTIPSPVADIETSSTEDSPPSNGEGISDVNGGINGGRERRHFRGFTSPEFRIITPDAASLFWVPAHQHPELAPTEYEKLLSRLRKSPVSDTISTASLSNSISSSSSLSLHRVSSISSSKYNLHHPQLSSSSTFRRVSYVRRRLSSDSIYYDTKSSLLHTSDTENVQTMDDGMIHFGSSNGGIDGYGKRRSVRHSRSISDDLMSEAGTPKLTRKNHIRAKGRNSSIPRSRSSIHSNNDMQSLVSVSNQTKELARLKVVKEESMLENKKKDGQVVDGLLETPLKHAVIRKKQSLLALENPAVKQIEIRKSNDSSITKEEEVVVVSIDDDLSVVGSKSSDSEGDSAETASIKSTSSIGSTSSSHGSVLSTSSAINPPLRSSSLVNNALKKGYSSDSELSNVAKDEDDKKEMGKMDGNEGGKEVGKEGDVVNIIKLKKKQNKFLKSVKEALSRTTSLSPPSPTTFISPSSTSTSTFPLISTTTSISTSTTTIVETEKEIKERKKLKRISKVERELLNNPTLQHSLYVMSHHKLSMPRDLSQQVLISNLIFKLIEHQNIQVQKESPVSSSNTNLKQSLSFLLPGIASNNNSSSSSSSSSSIGSIGSRDGTSGDNGENQEEKIRRQIEENKAREREKVNRKRERSERGRRKKSIKLLTRSVNSTSGIVVGGNINGSSKEDQWRLLYQDEDEDVVDRKKLQSADITTEIDQDGDDEKPLGLLLVR